MQLLEALMIPGLFTLFALALAGLLQHARREW